MSRTARSSKPVVGEAPSGDGRPLWTRLAGDDMLLRAECLLRWGGAGLLLVVCAACAGDRPPPAPRPVTPFGAIHLDDRDAGRALALAERRSGEVDPGFIDTLDVGPDGERIYPVLSLSGGGSYVAFAGGILTGWSDHGSRPEFRIVTAMSGGALVAPWAFLGPDYDRVLEQIFTTTDTPDVYSYGLLGPLGFAFGDSTVDFSAGEELLRSYITEEVVNAIAAEHRTGRRLYIATANMDDNVTTVWDIGEIAASDFPGRVERVQDVILAAIAVPGAFPPRYFEVTVDGETYGQMHTDAQIDHVYLREFMFQNDELIAWRQGRIDELQPVVYVILSAKTEAYFEEPPDAWAPILARRAMERLGRYAGDGAIDRLYLYSLAHGHDLQVALLPHDFDPGMANFEFATEGLRKLFALGRHQAAQGYPWLSTPPDLPLDDLPDLPLDREVRRTLPIGSGPAG